MARKAQIKKAAADSSEKPTGFLLGKFEDEIEIIEDGLSDVITPSLIRLGSIDRLREPEGWERSAEHCNDPASIETDRLLSSELFRLATALAAFATSRECHERVLAQMIHTFLDIEKITEDFPEGAERIKKVVGSLLAAGYEVAKDNVLTAHRRQNATMRPLKKKNAEKIPAVDRAKAIAFEQWEQDTTKVIRISEMADVVYKKLITEGFVELLPGSEERLKEWIKPVAPDYARRGGAPKSAHRRKTLRT